MIIQQLGCRNRDRGGRGKGSGSKEVIQEHMVHREGEVGFGEDRGLKKSWRRPLSPQDLLKGGEVLALKRSE